MVAREGGTKVWRCDRCLAHGQCPLAEANIGTPGEAHDLAYAIRLVRRKEAVYQVGDTFRSLYVVRFGTFKSYVVSEDGRYQIIAFPRAGDIVGADGIEDGAHTLTTVALETSEVCVFDYRQFVAKSPHLHDSRRHIDRLLGREVARQHRLTLLLGAMHAEERIAHFLSDMSTRYAARGYSATDFALPMSREEIGSHLGVKFETVSRVFSRLEKNGVIAARYRRVRILDPRALAELAKRTAPDDEETGRRRARAT